MIRQFEEVQVVEKIENKFLGALGWY